MVSRLVFKGEQPKKKKKSKGVSKPDSARRREKTSGPRAHDYATADDDSNDAVWVNAQTAAELIGPIVLVMVSQESFRYLFGCCC